MLNLTFFSQLITRIHCLINNTQIRSVEHKIRENATRCFCILAACFPRYYALRLKEKTKFSKNIEAGEKTLSVPFHHTILYYTILYYTILYYTILYYTILYYTILYYTICFTILYYTIIYYTILYYTILYYTILYYTILCYTL